MAAALDEFGNPTGENQQGDPNAERRNMVGQWYQQYLGRQGSDAEVNGWLGNPNFGSVEQSIKNSDEGQKYAAGPVQQPQTLAATSPWNREAFRDAWMSTGTNVGQQNQLLQQYGLSPDAAGRVTLPGGDLMDLRYGAKAGINRAAWTGVGPTAGPNGGGNGGGSGNGGSGSGTGASHLDPRINQLYEMLLGRAQQGTAVNRDDPAVRAQADAYAANAERARRNYLGDLAEKSGPMANLQGDARVTAEKLGQNTGAFEAELVGRELTAKRDEIAQALSSMQGLLTTEQQLALQKELGLLNNSIQQQQIGLQGQQMSQQNDQFMRTLGFNEADRGSYWDAVRSGLLN